MNVFHHLFVHVIGSLVNSRFTNFNPNSVTYGLLFIGIHYIM